MPEKLPRRLGIIGGSTKRYLLVAISLHSFIKNNLQSVGEMRKHYRQAAAITKKNEEEYFAVRSRSRSGECNVTI